HETVDEVQIPGRDGYLGILPGHAPLLSELQQGELSYRRGREWHYLTIFWGFVEVLPERVVVLAEAGERAEDIDIERARQARRRAQDRLKSPPDSDVNFDRARVALERSMIRLQVAGRASAGVRSSRP
ncbi:MAG: F0F1 ATP synthase subunit epsilon, partial [Terriglobia bacterium]